MSETQRHNPEVDARLTKELYGHCIDVFDVLEDKVVSVPGGSSTHINIAQSVELPPLNGKRVVLDWELPARDDDPTKPDTDIPLEWYDQTGKNHWHTPIGIKVYDEATGAELHDYSIARAGSTLETEPESFWAWDYHRDEYVYPEDYVDVVMTALDAKELLAHMDWAVEQANAGGQS